MGEHSQDLSLYRINEARRAIRSAKVLYEDGDYKGAANRAYYAIFHSMRSVLALDGVDFSKHSGVSSYFRKEYIKTGVFSTELSDIISSEFATRSDCDYDDFYELSPDEILEQIKNSENFYNTIKDYLESCG